MTTTRRIVVTEETQVGEARRCAIEICNRLGANETFRGKVAIVATEMSRNLVRHGGGGEFLVSEIPHRQSSSIDLFALDKGPGMRSISECMKDGYSSIGTAGNGLGAIKRISDRFDIYSVPNRGTVMWARLCPNAPQYLTERFETGGISVALQGEEVCGDAWETIETPGSLRLAIADGLGHGAFAEEAAREAIATFRNYSTASITEVMERAHQALLKTRGAAAAIVELRPLDQEATSVGIGNISMRLISPETVKTLISDNGTLGSSLRKVQSFRQQWSDNMLLVMHSDGIGSQWNLNDYPGLSHRHPSLIAGVLYRDFKRSRDDSTVIAVRYTPRS